MIAHPFRNAALVLVAHGERRELATNRTLLAHVAAIRARSEFAFVTAGTLRSEPSLETALEEISERNPERLIVYPFLMSDGYFVQRVLKERIASGICRCPVSFQTPLGLEPRLRELLLRESVATAARAHFEPATTHLLVAGHGSKFSDASASSTRAAAERLAEQGVFGTVTAAFLEQAPFLANELAAEKMPVVVAGFFSGEGMHAWTDVPAAIEETGAEASYTGPIGAHPEVADIILASVVGEQSLS